MSKSIRVVSSEYHREEDYTKNHKKARVNRTIYSTIFEFCDRHICIYRMCIGMKNEQTWIKMQQNGIIATGINYINILELKYDVIAGYNT
jgi:hypothetical protein